MNEWVISHFCESWHAFERVASHRCGIWRRRSKWWSRRKKWRARADVTFSTSLLRLVQILKHHTYKYVHTHIHVYIHIYVCTYIYVYIYIYICVYIHVCIYVFMYIYIWFVCTHVPRYTYTCIDIFAYINIESGRVLVNQCVTLCTISWKSYTHAHMQTYIYMHT